MVQLATNYKQACSKLPKKASKAASTALNMRPRSSKSPPSSRIDLLASFSSMPAISVPTSKQVPVLFRTRGNTVRKMNTSTRASLGKVAELYKASVDCAEVALQTLPGSADAPIPSSVQHPLQKTGTPHKRHSKL